MTRLNDRLNFLAALAGPYKKHFTASAVVIFQSHILLVDHKRIGAWVPPGGHIHDSELPHETAIRETKEETDLDVSISIDYLPDSAKKEAFFLPQPLAIHAVQALEKTEILYHVDFAYLCRVEHNSQAGLPKLKFSDELNNASWIELDKLEKIPLANNVLELLSLAKKTLGLD